MPSTPKLRVKGPRNQGSRVTFSSDYVLLNGIKEQPQLKVIIRLPTKKLRKAITKQPQFKVTMRVSANKLRSLTQETGEVENNDNDTSSNAINDNKEENYHHETDVLPLAPSQQPITDQDYIVSPSPAAPIPLGLLDFDNLPTRQLPPIDNNTSDEIIPSRLSKRLHDQLDDEELDSPTRSSRRDKRLRSNQVISTSLTNYNGNNNNNNNNAINNNNIHTNDDDIVITGENNHDASELNSDSDLSSFDVELNQALTSGVSVSTGSPLQEKHSRYYDAYATQPDVSQQTIPDSNKLTESGKGVGSNKTEDEEDDDVIIDPIQPLPPQSFTSGGPSTNGQLSNDQPSAGFRTRIQVAGNASHSHSPSFERPPFLRFERNSRPLTEEEKSKGYRKIPPTYATVMRRELSLFTDLANEDELSMIEKVIFSLKDPFSGAKIKLPVKSTSCKHFECFDFENFCKINQSKIPFNQRSTLKKDLCNKSYELRKLEKLFQEQQDKLGSSHLQRIQISNKRGKPPIYTYPQYSEHGQIFHFPLYNKTPPLFKCPVCDQLFGIKQLYISDVFNYFVKGTPKDIDRIELLDMESFRIIDPNQAKSSSSPGINRQEEIIELTDDDEEDNANNNTTTMLSSDDFNDGLDEVFMKLGRNVKEETSRLTDNLNRNNTVRLQRIKDHPGSGSWDDPVTLD